MRAGDWSEAWGLESATELLAMHPDVDAIYCGSDLIARGVGGRPDRCARGSA